MSLPMFIMTSHSIRRHAMPTDLIAYLLICFFAAGFIRPIGEVFADYDTQPADSKSKAGPR